MSETKTDSIPEMFERAIELTKTVTDTTAALLKQIEQIRASSPSDTRAAEKAEMAFVKAFALATLAATFGEGISKSLRKGAEQAGEPRKHNLVSEPLPENTPKPDPTLLN